METYFLQFMHYLVFKLHNVLLQYSFFTYFPSVRFKLHNVLLQTCSYFLLINSSTFSYSLSNLNFFVYFQFFLFCQNYKNLILLIFYLSNLDHFHSIAVVLLSYLTFGAVRQIFIKVLKFLFSNQQKH